MGKLRDKNFFKLFILEVSSYGNVVIKTVIKKERKNVLHIIYIY